MHGSGTLLVCGATVGWWVSCSGSLGVGPPCVVVAAVGGVGVLWVNLQPLHHHALPVLMGIWVCGVLGMGMSRK